MEDNTVPMRDRKGRLSFRSESIAEMSPEKLRDLARNIDSRLVELEIENDELRSAQEMLEESRSRYADFFDFAPVGYFMLGVDGLIREANLTGARQLGVERIHLQDTPFANYVLETDRPSFLEHLRKAFAQETRQTSEIRIRQENGTEFYAQLESVSDGKLCRTSVIDITQRKHEERNAIFIADLSETIRRIADPETLLRSVAQAVGEHLKASRCNFDEIQLEEDETVSHWFYHEGLLSSSRYSLSVFSVEVLDELKAGKRVVNCDCKNDPRTAARYRYIYKPFGFEAYVAVPLLRNGKWAATLYVIDNYPRTWTEHEVSLLEIIAERTWSALERARLNASLREKQELLAQAIDAANMGSWYLDVNTQEFVASDRALAMQHLNKVKKLSRKSVLKMIYPEDRAGVIAAIEAAIRDGAPYHTEFRTLWPDGAIRWLASRARISPGPKGPRLLGLIQDITDRKQTEKDLLESEHKHRRLFETMAEGVLYFDTKERLLSANPAAKEILGTRIAELKSKPFGVERWGAVYEDGRPLQPGDHPVTSVLKTGIPVRNVVIGVPTQKESDYRWISINSIPQFKPGKNRPSMVYATLTDITELKRAKDALKTANDELEFRVQERTRELKKANELLRSEQEVLQTVINNIPVMLTFYDGAGNFRLVNRELERVLGWTLEDLKTIDLMEAAYPDPEYRKIVWEFMTSASPQWRNFIIRTRYGRDLETAWANVRLSDGSQIGIGIDITKRK